ncbi:MAG: T9SS type A sorting domain-containing protein, partial [Ignavibacteriaceae bacterium]
SFYIDDGTAGTDIFMFGPPVFTWAMGDMLQITGEVDQYNGMTEIIPADTSGWVLIGSGNPTPDPIVLTLAQYKADSELYEGSLVGFISLSLVGGTWPASGSTNLEFSDGIDTVVFRIDSDTNIPGNPEPTWPRDVLGIGSQYDPSTPPDGGYQIFPRFFETDFLPPGTIPVELISFVASVNKNNVTLSWTTATETNNQGFEIQRNSGHNFQAVGFVNGHGTTTEVQEYSFTDVVTPGSYSYRLKQVDYNGTFSYSDQVEIVVPDVFTLEQNYPNPFNPSTKINFNLAVDSKVNLKVFDVLGQEVVTLISSNMVAGSHNVDFNASGLNSGVYFYRMDAAGIDGNNFTNVKKMILTK